MKGNPCNFFQSAGELMKVFKHFFKISKWKKAFPSDDPRKSQRQRVVALNSSRAFAFKTTRLAFLPRPSLRVYFILIKKKINRLLWFLQVSPLQTVCACSNVDYVDLRRFSPFFLFLFVFFFFFFLSNEFNGWQWNERVQPRELFKVRV